MTAFPLRGLAATLLVAGVASTAVAAAGPAAAATPGIWRPNLTVVCSQPHHAGLFTAAKYHQRGLWAAGGSVTVTISTARTHRTLATIKAKTDATGRFSIDKVLVRSASSPWRTGVKYDWLTEISGDSWATARAGTVALSGSC